MTELSITRRQALGAAGAGGAALVLGGLRFGPNGGLVGTSTEEALAASCVLTPAKTVGPYFVEEKLVRSDVRETQAGVPLVLSLSVFDADNDCAPVVGATVDIWHCNAVGLYSDEAANNTAGQTWLRGAQVTDATGKVTFTTIWPGWYSGRAIHIHFKVRTYDAAGNETLEFTSQMFFTDAANAKILTQSPYSTHGTKPDTVDSTDSIYGTDGATLLLNPTLSGSGYVADFSAGVSKSTSQLNNTSAGFGGGGGPGGAPPGGGAGGPGRPTATADTTVAASLSSLTAARTAAGTRQLKAKVKATEAVTVALKLTRSGRTLASRKATAVAVGTETLKLSLPSTVAGGAANLTLTLKDAAGNTSTVKRTVHVAARRS